MSFQTFFVDTASHVIFAFSLQTGDFHPNHALWDKFQSLSPYYEFFIWMLWMWFCWYITTLLLWTCNQCALHLFVQMLHVFCPTVTLLHVWTTIHIQMLKNNSWCLLCATTILWGRGKEWDKREIFSLKNAEYVFWVTQGQWFSSVTLKLTYAKLRYAISHYNYRFGNFYIMCHAKNVTCFKFLIPTTKKPITCSWPKLSIFTHFYRVYN